MRVRGSDMVVKALEDEGVPFTFGIPGTHNIELYDALERSSKVKPILVTDEQCASFMADGVSRTSGSIGVVNVVPGAGVTHCLSGVAEAYLDNIPLLVLTCGIRSDTGRAYQLHDVDQLAILKPITKATFKPQTADEIYSTIRRAIRLAKSGTPGPVAVEISAEYYLLTHEVTAPVYDDEEVTCLFPDDEKMSEAVRIIEESQFPALYVGFGAKDAGVHLRHLAEKLSVPVVTTVQGKGVFPESHPFWLWNGFGAQAPRFVNDIMGECDCLIAIGCRFGEVATASYGIKAPKNLIHVDINDEVFNRNFPARLAIQSDAAEFVKHLLLPVRKRERNPELEKKISKGHHEIKEAWQNNPSRDRVTPEAFFRVLQRQARGDAIYATDSGNGTFLAMEHLRLNHPACFIGPIDYSCMGYSVPAAIGAKFAHPKRDVIALAGDGALLMTGLELLTAAANNLGVVVFVLRDEELGQIAQFQRTTLNRDTCSILADYSVENFARAVNCDYYGLPTDTKLEEVIPAALEKSRRGIPVMVDVAIDYSQKTYFTKGVVKTNFWRLPWGERVRMVARLVSRHLGPRSA